MRSEIVAAFDADDAGRMLVELVRAVVTGVANETGRTDLIFQVHPRRGPSACRETSFEVLFPLHPR